MRYSMINCLILSFLSIETLYSQVEIVSVYPTQNYLTASRETDLYAVFNLDLDESTVVDTNIVVFAERTGTHFGNINYDAGSRTLTFDPDNDFIAGERVRVTLTNRIKGTSGESFRGFTWYFTVETFGSDDFDFKYKGDLPAGVSFYLAVSDFNNDGYPDMIARERYYRHAAHLYLNDQQGGFYYHSTIMDITGFYTSASGQVLDVNKDGWSDLFVNSNPQFFLMNQGNLTFNLVLIDSVVGTGGFGLVADFNNNGELDIVISAANGQDTLNIYRGLGEGRFVLQRQEPIQALALYTANEQYSDFNNDGFSDIISHLWTGSKVATLINQENFLFRVDIFDPSVWSDGGSSYINDMDGDGDMDFVEFGDTYANDSDTYLLYNNDEGTFTFGDFQPQGLTSGNVTGGDIDGDGDIDLVTDSIWAYNSEDQEGHVYILRNDGNEEFSPVGNYQVPGSFSGIRYKTLVDYDLDGDLDIVGLKEGYFLFWMENTSILSVDEKDNRVTIDDFYLYQNYPNPFNATTTISCQVPASSHVNLKIYDISGREVITLVNNTEEVGRHQVRWNGVDSRGKEVSSGIYFVQMKSNQYLQTRKTLLLR